MKHVYNTRPLQGRTVSAQSVRSRAGRSPTWYGRIPVSVLLDDAMSDRAKVAYGILSLKTFQGNIASIGVRELGKMLGICKSTTKVAVDELIAAGHIKAHHENGKRAVYELTSPVFAQKQRAGVNAIVSYPHRTLVSVEKTA